MHSDGDDLIAKGTVDIALKQDASAQDVKVALELRVLDEGGGMKDAIPLRVLGRKEFSWNGKTTGARISLSPGERISLQIESDRYPADWKMTFKPTVVPARPLEESS